MLDLFSSAFRISNEHKRAFRLEFREFRLIALGLPRQSLDALRLIAVSSC